MPKKLDDTEHRSGRPRWTGYAQIALILAVIAVALYFARAPERVQRDAFPDSTPEERKPAVNVIQPAQSDQSLTVELTGTVTLEERATVVSEVVGRIVWVSPNLGNGGSIAANEPIARVDPTELELEVEAAEMRVEEAEALIWMEKARGEEAVRSFSRENPGLEPSDWVRRLPAIAKAEAELGSARAALELAKLELARTEISLPYASRVISSDLEVGEVVGPDEQPGSRSVVGVVYRPRALQVRAPIEPKDLEYLAPALGRSARVQVRAATYDAEIVRVSSVVAPKTRLASLFLKFAEHQSPDSLPRPGTFVEIEITGPSYEKVYVLPESVLQEHDKVWVVEGGALRSFAPRTLGYTSAGRVVEAFDAGEGLVAGTLPGAREGLEVLVREATPSG